MGPRPAPANPPAAADDAPGAVDPAVPAVSAAELQAAAQALPSPRRPSSGVGTNVLLFFAILMVLIVALYTMNKDAPKEVSPFAGGPPPAAAPAPAAAPPPTAAPTAAAPAGKPVELSITVAEGLEAPQGTLFVILRQAGVSRGPPLAVKKVDNPSFPLQVQLGPADVMIKGMPFTGPFDLQVRLDGDGNAMTKTAGDLIVSDPASGLVPGGQATAVLDKRL